MKDVERKLETLSASCKSIDLSLIDLKSKDESFDTELRNVKVQVENLPEMSSSLEELKSAQSKVFYSFFFIILFCMVQQIRDDSSRQFYEFYKMFS